MTTHRISEDIIIEVQEENGAMFSLDFFQVEYGKLPMILTDPLGFLDISKLDIESDSERILRTLGRHTFRRVISEEDDKFSPQREESACLELDEWSLDREIKGSTGAEMVRGIYKDVLSARLRLICRIAHDATSRVPKTDTKKGKGDSVITIPIPASGNAEIRCMFFANDLCQGASPIIFIHGRDAQAFSNSELLPREGGVVKNCGGMKLMDIDHFSEDVANDDNGNLTGGKHKKYNLADTNNSYMINPRAIVVGQRKLSSHSFIAPVRISIYRDNNGKLRFLAKFSYGAEVIVPKEIACLRMVGKR